MSEGHERVALFPAAMAGTRALLAERRMQEGRSLGLPSSLQLRPALEPCWYLAMLSTHCAASEAQHSPQLSLSRHPQ